MAKLESIERSGVTYDAVRLRCRVLASRKGDEWIVIVPNVPGTVTPPSFFVDPILVSVAEEPAVGEEVDGAIKVLLLEQRDDDTLVIDVPGEPVSYGPKLLVPRSLVL